MEYKSGTNKAGKPYAGHFCAIGECPPVWDKSNRPQAASSGAPRSGPRPPRPDDDPKLWLAKQRSIIACSAASSACDYAARTGRGLEEVPALADKLYAGIMNAMRGGVLNPFTSGPAQPARKTAPPPPLEPPPPVSDDDIDWGPQDDPDGDIPF